MNKWISLALAAMVVWLFLYQKHPHLDLANPPAQTPIALAPQIVAPQPEANGSAPPAHEQDFVWVASQCLAQDPAIHLDRERIHSLDQLWRSYGQSLNKPQLNLQILNIHVRRPDQKELRLRIAPEDGEFQIFSVDAEGLPIREETPKELQDVSPQSAVAWIERQGDVIYREKHLSVRWDDGHSAQLTLENNQVREFQLFFAKNSLGCTAPATDQQPNCTCI